MARRHNVRAMMAGVTLCTVLGSFLLLSSCDVSGRSSVSGPRQGGSIVYDLPLDTNSLVPGRALFTKDTMVDQALWAPLWYLDPRGVLHPGLARDIPSLANGGISPDLKTWTIRLRSGLRWSDGSPLTAADVAFSLTTLADPRFNNTSGFPLRDSHDPIDFLGAVALDPTTVQFTIAHPNITMLTLLNEGSQGPIPEEIFGSMQPGGIPTSRQNFLPTVVSGPFMPKEHVQGDHLTVVRNPYYYQGPDKPYLDQITFKLFPDQHAISQAFQEGRLDAAYDVVSFANLDRYRGLPGYTTYMDTYPTSGFEALYFNLTNPILKDLAVRQALTMSLDPRQLIAQAMNGLAAPTCDDSVGTFAHEPSLTCYPQDPAQAAELLQHDGWVVGADGYRHKGGQRLELRYSTTILDFNSARPKTEALAQVAWGNIGIKLDIQNEPAHKFLGPDLYSGNFDIAELFRYAPYDPDDHWSFMCDQAPPQGAGNFMRYCSPEVDRLETAQKVTADTNARLGDFHRLHLAVLADLPVMYLYIPRLVGIYRSSLHNYMPTAVGSQDTWNVWAWYLSST